MPPAIPEIASTALRTFGRKSPAKKHGIHAAKKLYFALIMDNQST
jgi:hypothetical protein